MSNAPTGLPLLGRGAHRDASHGACLMEATALLAGERHNDRPVSVHPALAALARVVNDAVSDSARPRLLVLAPEMIGSADGSDLSRALVELCTRRAWAVALPIWAPRLRRDLRRAAAGKPFTAQRAARTVSLAAASLALATHGNRDEVLVGLLTEATELAAARSRPGDLDRTRPAPTGTPPIAARTQDAAEVDPDLAIHYYDA